MAGINNSMMRYTWAEDIYILHSMEAQECSRNLITLTTIMKIRKVTLECTRLVTGLIKDKLEGVYHLGQISKEKDQWIQGKDKNEEASLLFDTLIENLR